MGIEERYPKEAEKHGRVICGNTLHGGDCLMKLDYEHNEMDEVDHEFDVQEVMRSVRKW